MIPTRIHMFWEGTMPLKVIRWTSSVIENHPEWEVRLWNLHTISVLGISPNVDVIKEYGSWANLSNVVRLLAVYKYGGIWLDSDCECLKPLDPLLKYSAFTAIQDFEAIQGNTGDNAGRINGAVFGAEAGHPWIKWQVDAMATIRDCSPLWIVWTMSVAPRDGLTILPTEFFFPFPHDAPLENRKPHPDSYLVHHWLASWK